MRKTPFFVHVAVVICFLNFQFSFILFCLFLFDFILVRFVTTPLFTCGLSDFFFSFFCGFLGFDFLYFHLGIIMGLRDFLM